jgi:hypothetical protein
MNFRSDAVLSDVLWPDAELCRIDIDYGDLRLVLRESSGLIKQVICEGYLGYELVGFWDEIVVANAELVDSGPFLDRCMSSIMHRLGTSPFPSGSEARNRERVMQLILTFGDGCQLNVATKGLRVEALNK